MDGNRASIVPTNSIRPADQYVGQNQLLRLHTPAIRVEVLVSISTTGTPSCYAGKGLKRVK